MTRPPSDDAEAQVQQAYSEVQTIAAPDVPASDEELGELANSWKDDELPGLQRRVVDVQLANLERGIVDPVFATLAKALERVDLPAFSILDAACATGYYSEVIRRLDQRRIDYSGCDYSPAMIEAARAHHPGIAFSVQDLTALAEADRSFDVVLLAGVLEHIPDYPRAIEEAGRVARRYLIVHRCPMTARPAHDRRIGTQYNIRTPRTRFSLSLLRSEFEGEDFELIESIEVYPEALSWRRRARRMISRLRKRNRRTTLTLVFRRREPAGSR
jgi:SAM-dependent methyltransferase